MTTIFLVRHGQASAGTANYDRLSDIGKEQARLLGLFWQRQGISIDAVYSGNLQRQQHTAELALQALTDCPSVNTLDALNEYDHHVIDRLYGNGVQSDMGDGLRFDQYVEIMKQWRDAHTDNNILSWQDFSMQGWKAVCGRVDAHKQTQKKSNLVFFTSGGVIATILGQVLKLDFEAIMHALWQTRNASITSLQFTEHGPCLLDYNTVSHLHVEHDSALLTQI